MLVFQSLFILCYNDHLKWLRNIEQKLIVIKYFNTSVVQLLGQQGMTTTWNAPPGEIVSEQLKTTTGIVIIIYS